MPALPDCRALAEIPLFKGLSDADLGAINLQMRSKVFASGANVIAFEMPGDVIYIIQDGTLKIKVDQADGREVVIAVLGKGEIVGELSIIDGDRRSADVVTQEKSTLLWLDRERFEQLVQSNSQVTGNLLRILTRRVRLSTEQIQALNTLDVQGKVSRQLLVFADQYGVRTPAGLQIPMRLTQGDIACMVGASRERVNLAFGNLKKRKLISYDQTRRVTVLDRAKLAKELLR